MTSNHCIDHITPTITPTIYVITSILYDITCRKWQPTPVFLPVESQVQRNLVGSFSLYMTSDPIVFMTTQSLYFKSHACYLWFHTYHNYDHIHCIYVITSTKYDISYLFMASNPLNDSHHFIYDITPTISAITHTILMTSQPQYLWHHTHYVCHHIQCDVSVTSHTFYWWHHTHCNADIMPTVSIILFSLYLWHHTFSI